MFSCFRTPSLSALARLQSPNWYWIALAVDVRRP